MCNSLIELLLKKNKKTGNNVTFVIQERDIAAIKDSVLVYLKSTNPSKPSFP
jgi:hypothetical protein